MSRTLLSSLIGASLLSTVVVGTAMAGGLERGGYNIDLLFDPSRFAAEATATYVMPDRKIENAVDTDPTTALVPPGSPGFGRGGGNLNGRSTTADDSEPYWVPRIGIKAGMAGFDCMIDYSQPWGVHSNPGLNWAGANSNIETKIDSDNYAGTCSYKFDVGKGGQLRLIGGVFYQEVDGFKTRLVQDFTGIPVPFTGIGRIDLEGDGVGWRIGAAYEIPEIAFRASLVYNSEVDLGDVTGTVDLTQAGRTSIPVFGTASMPASVEFKVQTGIAPDWLAFGSVKWVDWSVLQVVSFCSTAVKSLGCSYQGPGFVTSLDLLYRDGWTVQGGVGHRFNDQWSGAVSLTWDRGTTTGLSSQTDTWTVSAGAAYTPNQNVEVRLGGALGILTSGSVGAVESDGNTFGTDVSYDFGNDLVSALSGSLKVKF